MLEPYRPAWLRLGIVNGFEGDNGNTGCGISFSGAFCRESFQRYLFHDSQTGRSRCKDGADFFVYSFGGTIRVGAGTEELYQEGVVNDKVFNAVELYFDGESIRQRRLVVCIVES